MNKKISWIFFDLDGTLIDSVTTLYEAYISFLSEFNITSNRKEFEKLNGPSIPEIVCILKDKYKLKGDKNHLVEIYFNKINETYKNNIKPVTDANYILEKLSENYKLSLVTSSSRKIASELIKQQGWEKYFQSYVFGDEIKYSKPNPEIYELALKKSGSIPNNVIVVEDSINGIKSAKSAGIFTIGFANNHSERELSSAGADIVITKLEDVISIL
jgi:HAD superfamily hydrolase (TIGR01509 family)